MASEMTGTGAGGTAAHDCTLKQSGWRQQGKKNRHAGIARVAALADASTPPHDHCVTSVFCFQELFLIDFPHNMQ